MAKTKASTATETSDRSETMNIGPDKSDGVISAWDGLYHIFGARAEGFDVTPEGLVITGFSVDSQYADILPQLIDDLNARGHRVPLYPAIQWINGMEPTFDVENDGSTWLVQAFKGSVPEGANRAPKYARDAMANTKATLGVARKRGPRPGNKFAKQLTQIDVETLKNVDPEGLAHLREVLAQIDPSALAEVSSR